MCPGAGGRWLLRTIFGAILRTASSSCANTPLSTLRQPRRVYRRPEHLPVPQIRVREFGRVLRNRLEERAKAVRAEEHARFLVVEAGGAGVVEHGRLEGGQCAVAHRDLLARIDEIHPVQRQRGSRQPHDADAEKGRDDPEPRILRQQLRQTADVVEVRMGEPQPSQVGGIDDGPKRRHELRALHRSPRIDQDGLRALDDERVDRDHAVAWDWEAGREHVDIRSSLERIDHGNILRQRPSFPFLGEYVSRPGGPLHAGPTKPPGRAGCACGGRCTHRAGARCPGHRT